MGMVRGSPQTHEARGACTPCQQVLPSGLALAEGLTGIDAAGSVPGAVVQCCHYRGIHSRGERPVTKHSWQSLARFPGGAWGWVCG